MNNTVIQKIPKLIHYCWLSVDQKPELIQRCIESWKIAMPDFHFVCWDMKRFDVKSIPFVREACEAKKWAFACDYIRLYALYHYGGIYLDCDVYAYKSLTPFLHHSAFSSVEFHSKMFLDSIREGRMDGDTDGLGIEAAVMGAMPKHPWIKACLEYYGDKHFENSLKHMNKMILPGIISMIAARDFGFKYDPVFQILKDDIVLYPPDVFSRVSANSVTKYTSHLCAHSWYPTDGENKQTNP